MNIAFSTFFLGMWKKRQREFPPLWFNATGRIDTYDVERPFFLFQSWIPEHTDKLIHSVRRSSTDFVDLDMFRDPSSKLERVEILRFSESHPDLFRRMALHKLSRYRNKAAGLVVTLDWIPAMRHIVYAASQLNLPTILVPHESVFAKESMYYTHPRLGIRVPACDLICAWGDLQERIFVERGYPSERIIKTGTPKFDYFDRARKSSDRSALALLGLAPSRPVITFAAQPLDSQYDKAKAREAQETALLCVINWAKHHKTAQVLVRMPPSRDEVFSQKIYKQINDLPNVVIDSSNLYLLTAEETIEASDVVISVNSTMLLEAALCGKVAIASKFLEFEQIWDNLKIPVARNSGELNSVLTKAFTDGSEIISLYNVEWAARAFSNGSFDGGAALRVGAVLKDIATGQFSFQSAFSQTVPFAPTTL